MKKKLHTEFLSEYLYSILLIHLSQWGGAQKEILQFVTRKINYEKTLRVGFLPKTYQSPAEKM